MVEAEIKRNMDRGAFQLGNFEDIMSYIGATPNGDRTWRKGEITISYEFGQRTACGNYNAVTVRITGENSNEVSGLREKIENKSRKYS